jgi:phosphatidylserine/phosphatidylglycerophosphate/cardiolipin synthase-like enzyme
MMAQEVEAREARNWWAADDTPLHRDSHVAYLVDGRIAMLEMCRHFLTAHHYIYLANWGLTATMEIVRGKDHRAGPDGSPEQEALLAELRAVGLQEEDLNFWQQNALTVQNVLGYAVRKGVDVKVLIWKGTSLFSHCDVEAAEKELKIADVQCILDDSAFGILHHPIESLHQKIAIVDGGHAFVGGIDLVIEEGDKFDRWDTHDHPFSTPLRRKPDGTTSHPWHDVHSIIDGPAAADVELNFRQRWNDVVQRKHMDESLLIPEHAEAPPVETSTVMQIARTIPEHTYSFGLPPNNSIHGIAQLYSNALSNIQRFVYLENQYLWLRAYIGVDIPFTSYESADMVHNIQALITALKHGAAMSIILPDHPNVGRAFSDAGLMKIRQEAPEAVEQGRFAAFTLASSAIQSEHTHYRPIYVHAKVAIVDDLWTTVGSANLNNRGMRDDTEMNIATLDPQLAHGLRLMLQAEHLGLVSEDELFELSRLLGRLHQKPEEQEASASILKNLHEKLGDPLTALHLMHDRAQENLARYKANQPLQGYLLPYLTAEEATTQGLHFQEEHGWIEEP